MTSGDARFFDNLRAKLHAFPLTSRYLVGVSGGRDSVALLHWLVASGYRHLIVCHLDHRLRGRSAKADARFVEKLADEHGAEFEVNAVDVRSLATTRKISIELAGRNARYEFFARVARRKRCRTIFLGHHADDFVETFLINLFRGAGPRGLSGMREISSRRIDDVELTIVRPFLSVWRKDLDRYIRQHRFEISRRRIKPRPFGVAQSRPSRRYSVSGKNAWPQHSRGHLACGHDYRRRGRFF